MVSEVSDLRIHKGLPLYIKLSYFGKHKMNRNERKIPSGFETYKDILTCVCGDLMPIPNSS